MGTPKDKYPEFLLKLYETAWSNITRIDDLLWKAFFSYSTVILSTLFLSGQVLKAPAYGLAITFLVTAVATCHAFNVNAWFLRNLVMLTNIERQFLDDKDYGLIIPNNWKPPFAGNFINIKEFPTILGILYPMFAFILSMAYWSTLSSGQQTKLWALAFTLLGLTLAYVAGLWMRFESLKKDAPGRSS